MSTNLRSKKASEGATDTIEDGNENFLEFRSRLQRLEEKSTTLCNDITELKTSVEFANSEVQVVKPI